MGNGNGRVYAITFKVTDASGNVGTATAKVTVPHSQNGSAAVDDGPHYTALSGPLFLAGQGGLRLTKPARLNRNGQHDLEMKSFGELRISSNVPLAYLIGGGAMDGGTGFPSTVFGSINSIRVPSGSKRFAWRLPFLPTFISIGLP